MKKLLVAFVLALFTVAAAEPFPQESAPSQKVIKDPAEHNAYVGAVSQQDPQARISGIEGFLAQYPGSVMKEEALVALMGAYQQAGNAAKMLDSAQRVLQVNPNNLGALTGVVLLKKSMAEQGQNAEQNLTEAKQVAERGIEVLPKAPRPEGVPEADFEKQKTLIGALFHSVMGWAALQAKDYQNAQKHLRTAVDVDPSQFNEVYRLALAHLESGSPTPEGLWFAARAVNLSNQHKDVLKYGRNRYRRYHGGEDGWAELLAQTKATPFPPAGFTVKPAPTPIEQAAQIVDSKPINKMSFGEFEFVLEVGGEPAQKVWGQIQGVPLVFTGKVISSTRSKLMVAATENAIEENRADAEITLAAPLPVRLVPKVGADITIQAEPSAYDPKPFVMKLEKGVLIQRQAPGRRSRR
ncbi:MAG: tetratricopeptide repeat protein [Terriglobales bacterium]